MLSIDEAVQLLKNEGITDSKEMVRRWVRQGKIENAIRESRKKGWRIPEDSLNRFINTHRIESSNKKEGDYEKGYRQGQEDAMSAIKERDYHLLHQSGVHERSFYLDRTNLMEIAEKTFSDSAKNKEFRKFIDQTLFAKHIKTPRKDLSIYILGDWIMIEETLEIFEITKLPEKDYTLSDRLSYALINKRAKDFIKE